MRKVIEKQMTFGAVPIDKIKFDPRSRDEIPKLLRGLQSIYCNQVIRKSVFEVLEEIVPKSINPKNGRKGMDLWKIFVMGTLRLNCNWDYDKLLEMVNNHGILRQMLGHGIMDADHKYALQTLRDNLGLLTPEILDKINQIVINHGHEIVGKKKDEKLRGSCDSFVVETDVHYPTDINLLFDAIRKIITLIAALCIHFNISDWRQSISNIRKVKRLFRKAQQLKRSTSKDSKKKAQREELIINAHKIYIELVQKYIDKTKCTIDSMQSSDIVLYFKIEEIKTYIVHAERQIKQIGQRVIEGKTIPHHEKVFSIFEEHTEWISKGKAGVPVELGLKVCIVKDDYGFILHHHVMQNETDDKIAVSIIKETKIRFADFNMCSFDKGFHSPKNQEKLASILDEVVLPRKGKLSEKNKAIEHSKEFIAAKRKHSAVESSINALENHGLDRCRDSGIDGFKRYIALAVVARNIQIIGHILQQKEVQKPKRLKDKQKQAA